MLKTEKVTSAATTARPYVERAINDDELRDSVKSAFSAVREIYGELVGDRGHVARVATRVATDEDIHDNLRTAISELRNAAERLQGNQEERHRGRFLLFVGVVLTVLFNPITGPGTRGWVKSKLFGGKDDYAYAGGAGGNGSV